MNDALVRKLKLNHLRLLHAIAEHRQIGLAAEQMAITQPAASRMLSELEGLVGERLFDRHAKGMTPTRMGTALAQRARALLLDLADLGREVAELKQGIGGSVTVGAVTGAAVSLVIPATRQLKLTAPNAEISINVGTSSELVRDLVEGRNDFVLARLPEGFEASEFDVHPARTETVEFMVGEDHPLAKSRRKVPLQALVDYEWVMQSHRAPIREAVDNALLSAGAQLPRNVINTTSLLAMIAIVASSSAIAPVASEVVNLLNAKAVGARLRALKIETPIVMPPYYLLHLKDRQLSPLANRLMDLLLESLDADS